MLRNKGIYLGNWYSHVIDPPDVILEKVYYKKGMCPKAEYMAERIINLPTYPMLRNSDVQKIVDLVKKYVRHQRS